MYGGRREGGESGWLYWLCFRLQNVGGSDDTVMAWQDHTLEGTSQSLEKQYLRLTSVSAQNTRQGSWVSSCTWSTSGSGPEYRASTDCPQESLWSRDVKVAELRWLPLHLRAVQVDQAGPHCKQQSTLWVLSLLIVSAFHSFRQFETSLLCWCTRLMPELLCRRSVNILANWLFSSFLCHHDWSRVIVVSSTNVRHS